MQHNSRGAPDLRSGKRKSIGKRKPSDQPESSRSLSHQSSIPDIFSRPGNRSPHPPGSSQSTKRPRLSPSPAPRSNTLISPGKMYNFADSGVSLGQGSGQAEKPAFSNTAPRQSTFAPHTGSKRLVVKNLRSGPRLNQDSYFEKVWVLLEAALVAIFDGRKPETSLEELYKGSENVCRQGKAAALARNLQDKCRGYVSGWLRQNLLSRTGGASNIDTLRAVVDAWATWQSKLVTVRWMFYYLDQSFLLHSKEFPVIREMGLVQFRTHIFADDVLKPKVLQGAYDPIQADRNDAHSIVADSSLLRNAIELFHSLDVYTTDFEPLLISLSRAFFSSWAHEQAARYLVTYVENCHLLVEREATRCELFSLNRSTKQKLSELLDQALVADQEAVLLNERDILGLLRNKDNAALQKLYTLLNRKDLGTRLKAVFSKYIIEDGTNIVFDEENESEMVVCLLEFKRSLDDTWVSSFLWNQELGHTLREAFATFMNKKNEGSTGPTKDLKTGELIAKYVDKLLKGGWKLASGGRAGDIPLVDEDAEINRQLDQVLDLFRFVHGKDMFEAFYKNDLARRLLMGRSASDDAEKSMLAKLKTECGSNFTHNLESMFKDMDVARDEMASYNSIKTERKHRLPVDLNVSVISEASWPSYPNVPVQVPPVVMTAINDFENFYCTKHSGRKLQWKHQLAHCQLRARFPKGNKELIVSSFQAIVLLLFNEVPDGESLNYGQIQEATKLTDAELQRTLQSLACARYRVLSKKPKGREVATTDEFTFNEGFSDAKMRIKINQIQLKETKEENAKTHERVVKDRQFETKAAIVRIMKSRRRITHAELVAEVIKATRSRGVLELAEIKTNIEQLIEMDYMEREENNSYQYVA